MNERKLASISLPNSIGSLDKLPLIAILISLLVITTPLSFYSPYWETNDDIAMAMVAHGYGLAAIASPNIIFSNIVWGHIIRVIPEIANIQGYSLATYLVLTIAATGVTYSLLKFQTTLLSTTILLIILFIQPILFPQFTINSGLVMVAAILLLHLFLEHKKTIHIITACLLIYLSFIIRSQEALLVLAVSFPTFQWRKAFKTRHLVLAIVSTTLIIVGTIAYDHFSYLGQQWTSYNQLNPVRAQYTDFGAGANIIHNTDVLNQYGLSVNDINLIINWFFVDKNIANPDVLKAILSEIDTRDLNSRTISSGWKGISALWNSNLYPITLFALAILLIYPSKRTALSWLIFIISIFAIGLLGRPGITRIYYPVLCFLIAIPIALAASNQWKSMILPVILAFSCWLIVPNIIYRSNSASKYAANKQIAFKSFPETTTVLWGGAFPFESLYPALGPDKKTKAYKIYGLGVFTLAPFSVPFVESQNGRGFITRLLSKNGIPIIGYKKSFKQLEIYCAEHHNGTLEQLSSKKYGSTTVSTRRCSKSN